MCSKHHEINLLKTNKEHNRVITADIAAMFAIEIVIVYTFSIFQKLKNG